MMAGRTQAVFGKISERKKRRGFTLVEVLVVSVLLALLAGAVLRGAIMVLQGLQRNSLHLGAMNLIQQQIETLRGMDYYRLGIHPGDNIGYINRTVVTNDVYDATNDVLLSSSVVLSDGGTTTTSDDVNATLITYVWHVDDAWDGTGVSDADGDTNDYKRVRVQITWDNMGKQVVRFVETFIYGIVSDDSEPEAQGGGEDPPGGGDPPSIEITKAEYKTKDNKFELKVEAIDNESGVPTLTLVGYGVMEYKASKDKHEYKQKPEPDPGPTVTVTSTGGGSDTHPVTIKD